MLYTAAFIALTVFSIGQIIVGLGYRVLGGIFLKAAALATAGAIAGGILAVVVMMQMSHGPYAEGLGVALLFLLVGGAILGWCVTFFAAFIWLKRRQPERALTRASRSNLRSALGVLGIAPACIAAGYSFYLQTPSILSNDQLISQILERRQREPEALTELLRRGATTVPDVLLRLEKEVPSAPNTYDFVRLFELLGKIGGAQAKTAVRQYLTGDFHPSVRARAASVLATDFHDTESTAAIAELLSHRTLEWRKYHAIIFEALSNLDAKEQVPAIISALEIERKIAGSSIETGILHSGILALAKFGGDQAWSTILKFSNAPKTRYFTFQLLRNIDTKESQELFLPALDDSDPSIKREACTNLLAMQSLRPNLSYWTCPLPDEQAWPIVINEIRRALAMKKENLSATPTPLVSGVNE